jgi:hypothetical protein
VFDEHIRLYGCNPFKTGELNFDDQYQAAWTEQEGGRLSLWLLLTVDGGPPHNYDYVIGCDVATGIGGEWSTNSVASVVNRATGEKVAEFCANTLYPDRFADYVIAMRKWFYGPSGDAFVIWEMNGPGLQFGRHFTQHSPGRLYYKRDDKTPGSKISKTPGWFSTREQKRILLGEYGKAVERGSFINHSIEALQEMFHYVYFPDGSVDHDRSKTTLDPTSAGENHGDRVIADATAWRVIGNVPTKEKERKPAMIPYGSMAWRNEQHQRRREVAWL